MPRIAIGLGSNIDPEKNLQAGAVLVRDRFPGVRFSGVWRSAPMGKTDQADFLNAVAVFEADAPPAAILEVLRGIEQSMGKHVTERFGPRTLDLDLLLYGDDFVEMPGLSVPHPRMHERKFVLAPLLELLPENEHHPRRGKTWAELLSNVDGQRCERMEGITL